MITLLTYARGAIAILNASLRVPLWLIILLGMTVGVLYMRVVYYHNQDRARVVAALQRELATQKRLARMRADLAEKQKARARETEARARALAVRQQKLEDALRSAAGGDLSCWSEDVVNMLNEGVEP